MPDAGALGGGRLGCPNVHAAVDLARVHRDDLGIQGGGDRQREGRLADCRRANQGQDGRLPGRGCGHGGLFRGPGLHSPLRATVDMLAVAARDYSVKDLERAGGRRCAEGAAR